MSARPLIASIDQGTTSTRCVIFDDASRIVAQHQLEHRQIYPQSGWIEHDPAEIWQRTCETVRGALDRAGGCATDVVAVGIANQRETTVAWDKRSGKPVANAIVWSDTRTRQLCDRLAEGNPDRFRDRCGLPLATYFSGPKLRWLLDNNHGLREAAGRGDVVFGTIDTWLLWNLTGGVDGGVHVTDVTNASRTILLNLRTLDWDDTLLHAIGVPRAMLPKVVSCNAPNGFGVTRKDGPFGRRIPITGVVGDQQAALIGQACLSHGESKNTYGTGCFLLVNTGTSPVTSTHGMLTTVAYRFHDRPAHYALEGSIAAAGSLVQWARDNLNLVESADAIEPLAGSVTDSGGVCFVPAFSGLFAPWWRSDARGTVVGLTQASTKAHLARAILDAVAWQTRDVLDAIARDSGAAIESLKVDGGMSANSLLMQIQSDALGIPIVRNAVRETTALGAAYAAGLAVGVWPDTDALRNAWRSDATWTPQVDRNTCDTAHATWLRAIEKSKNWVV